MKIKLLTSLFFAFCIYSTGIAQNTITGKVTAFRTYTLNKVTVKARKSKSIVQTDSMGNFTITCKSKDVLRFYAEGFISQSIRVKDDKELEVNLIYNDDSGSFDEVIEGGHMTVEALEYCVSALLDDNNNYYQYQNIFQIIQAEYPGAKVEESNGVKRVVLVSRGPNSLQSGNQALLLVDGIPTEDISNIQTNQVKSIRVHVGNEASDWGIRGSNGVVEIDLKTGV